MDRRRFLRLGLAAGLGAAACGPGVADRAAPTPRAAPPTPTPSPSATPSELAVGEAPPAGTDGEPLPEPTPADQEPVALEPVSLEVLCREAWGAAAPGPGLVPHAITGLMLHHTAVVLDDDRKAPARLRQHQRYHQDQGWPDIAYHVGVDRRGNVYDLRDDAYRGDTFTAYDPTGWFLVVAEGHYDRQQPTDAQLERLAAVFAWGAAAHGAPLDTLTGHRDLAATTCPGDHLHARLPDLRARAHQLLDRGVERQELCGPDGRARVAAIEAGSA